MKIFNWVHRRFHHKYDEAVGGEDVTKTEFTGNGKDKLSLLENAALIDTTTTAFGCGWEEGILAIGTFGFDPAAALWKDFEVHKDHTYLCEFRPFGGEEYLCDDYGGDQQEEKEEIESPLVLKAYCKHGFFYDDHAQYCDEVSKPNYHHDQAGKVANKIKIGGERITLADLFWAHDSSSEKKLKNKKTRHHDHEDQAIKVHYDHNIESNINTNIKHANSLHDNDDDDDRVDLMSMKKLITTRDHAASRPIKKINLMVRKVLKKKKIHPDVENRKDTAVRLKPMRKPQSVKNAYP